MSTPPQYFPPLPFAGNFPVLPETEPKQHVYVCALTGWVDDSLAANLTAADMSRIDNGFSLTVVQMPRPGSIISISCGSNGARSAGTATFEVYKNDVATGITTVLDANNTARNYTNPTVTTGFSTGDFLAAKVTTSAAWEPTTADVEAVIWVAIEGGPT